MQFPFSAVCFDMDGVLIQSRQTIEHCWATIATAHGVTLTATLINDHIHGRPGMYTLNTLFGTFSDSERLKIKQCVDAAEETAPCPLVPGVFSMLIELRRAGLPVALVTSSWPARIQFVLDMHRLDDFFDHIINREHVASGKPSPACYRLAADRLGVAPSDCLVFEDSPSGVMAAVQSGACCIGIGDDPSLLHYGATAQYIDFNALSLRFSSQCGSFFEPDTHCLHMVIPHTAPGEIA